MVGRPQDELLHRIYPGDPLQEYNPCMAIRVFSTAIEGSIYVARSTAEEGGSKCWSDVYGKVHPSHWFQEQQAPNGPSRASTKLYQLAHNTCTFYMPYTSNQQTRHQYSNKLRKQRKPSHTPSSHDLTPATFKSTLAPSPCRG